jgi:hypothetical protein
MLGAIVVAILFVVAIWGTAIHYINARHREEVVRLYKVCSETKDKGFLDYKIKRKLADHLSVWFAINKQRNPKFSTRDFENHVAQNNLGRAREMVHTYKKNPCVTAPSNTIFYSIPSKMENIQINIVYGEYVAGH